MDPGVNGLLTPDDPEACVVINRGGKSPYLVAGDHAGRAVPARLGDLDLTPGDMDRHIAWDIGVAGLGDKLSARLDACFIRQAYSRLVIDCNRKLGADGSIALVSDHTPIPGNQNLSPAEVAARQTEIFGAYHGQITQALDERAAAGRPTLFVALHSFTPVFQGFVRPWRYGVLHRNDSRLSTRVLDLLRQRYGDEVGDNLPYDLGDIDNTVPMHADSRGLDYLELEVRQDLIADEGGQENQAGVLGDILRDALL